VIPDGIAVISSVMDFPIHDYPHDYWRFTPEAFKSILRPFSSSFVGFQGRQSFPHTIVGIGFKGNRPQLTEFAKEFEKWQKADEKSIRQLALKLTPPIILPTVIWLYRTIVSITRRAS
jgi:hypothetical protein